MAHFPAAGFREWLPEDRDRLPALAHRIFADTFRHAFDTAAFDAFCERAYGPGGSMRRDMSDPEILWRVAEHAGEPVGYAKLRPLVAPAPAPRPGAMELQQIYVLRAWQGRGVAQELMYWAITSASEKGAPELYLTVFDHNERAKRFYARNGFAEVGRCTFELGGVQHDDRIWRKTLLPRTAHMPAVPV